MKHLTITCIHFQPTNLHHARGEEGVALVRQRRRLVHPGTEPEAPGGQGQHAKLVDGKVIAWHAHIT